MGNQARGYRISRSFGNVVAGVMVVALSVVLSGCGSTRPAQYSFATERNIALSREEIMRRVVEWCALNAFNVTHSTETVVTASSDIMRIQGLQYSSWDGYSATNPVADCGSAPIGAKFYSNSALLTVSITDLSSTQGVAKVSIVFSPKPMEGTLTHCVSNGKIEEMIFAQLMK
jgi:hypothetical protein